jgi:hypothetical protein
MDPDAPEIDIHHRAWRKRLAAIRESPLRVVLAGCAFCYGAMLFFAFAAIIQENYPLREKLWHMFAATIGLAFLVYLLGLVVYPIVFLLRWFSGAIHRHKIGNEPRLPIEQTPVEITAVTANVPLTQHPRNICNEERNT